MIRIREIYDVQSTGSAGAELGTRLIGLCGRLARGGGYLFKLQGIVANGGRMVRDGGRLFELQDGVQTQ